MCDSFLTTCLLADVQLLHTNDIFGEGCYLNNLDDLALGILQFLNIDLESLGSRLASFWFGLRNFSWRRRQTATALLGRCHLEKYSMCSRTDDGFRTCVARTEPPLTSASCGEILEVTSVRIQSLPDFQRYSGPFHHKRLSINSCTLKPREAISAGFCFVPM